MKIGEQTLREDDNNKSNEKLIDEVLYKLENLVEKVIINKKDEEKEALEEVLVGMMGHPVQ